MRVIQSSNLLTEKSKAISKLLQHEGLEVINIQLKMGEEIAEHSAPVHVLVVIRQGKVLFQIEGESPTLTNEEIIFINPGEKHALEALEDADILVIKMKI